MLGEATNLGPSFSEVWVKFCRSVTRTGAWRKPIRRVGYLYCNLLPTNTYQPVCNYSIYYGCVCVCMHEYYVHHVTAMDQYDGLL